MFAAIGSEARSLALQLLVWAGPEGLPVGEIQRHLGIGASTLTYHLRFWAAAVLVEQERQGRAIICCAAFSRVEAPADFLVRECCIDQSYLAKEAWP